MSNTPMHGSDVQVTPEWWKASDGRFYPPELHPDYVKPAAPAAAEPPSLVDQAKAAAEDAAAAARSTMDDVPSAGGPAAAVDSASSAVSAAAQDAVADVMPDLAKPSFDPKATIPQDSAAGGVAQTIIHSGAPLASPGAPPSIPPSTPPSMPPTTPPSMPPSSPGAPPSMPPSPGAPPAMPAGSPPTMPPSPGAPPLTPPGMPPAPGAPPSAPPGMPPAPGPRVSPQPGSVEQGPGGITYTAPQAPSTMPPPLTEPAQSYGTPTAPLASASKVASSTSGLVALIAGAASIAGSLLLWGSGDVIGANGAEKGIIEVAGFDSSGLFAAVGGGVLILCGILFFMGIPQQTYWAGAAFITGAVIVGAVVFSAIDIQDLSDRLAAQFISEGRVVNGDSVNVSPAIGLWISGVGGVLGVLAAPFVNRS